MKKETTVIKIGNILIGGGNRISIQSMTNTDTKNISATVAQIKELENAGVDIVRLAVLDEDAAIAIKAIKAQVSVPLIADIHFDHKLALKSMESGIDALRLNPGNIRNKENVKIVINEAKDRKIPIRVGVNGGSLDTTKYSHPTAENMLASASEHITLMEDLGFTDIKVSLKASDILTTIKVNELFREKYNYPLHLGVTEAGTLKSSLIKSTSALSYLLLNGIGDTLRYSITGNPVEEVLAGKKLLKFLEISKEPSIEIISCPTCGRTTSDIDYIASEVERLTLNIKKNIKIAVMGCIVNGPGEAKHADFGIAATNNNAFLFFEKDNAPIKIEANKVIEFLIDKINKF